jgi:LacI family transcriptional regulator
VTSATDTQHHRIRRPTVRDVARLARVSPSTVSRVLNGAGQVAPDLADRVSSAVETLGYRHNVAARNLRRANGSSASIGVILEDISNPFFSAIHRGIEDVARDRSVLTFAGSCDEDARMERELVEAFLARRVDGLVIVPAARTPDHGYLRRDVQAGVAVVFVDRVPRALDADTVIVDNVDGARAAVSHLAAIGHRGIAFLGDDAHLFTARQRRRGYRKALAQHRLVEDPGLVRHLRFPAADAAAAVLELLARRSPPTAIFSAQNLITLGALSGLQRMERQHEVALVGFDEVPFADLLAPPVAVVAQDPYAMGRTAADLLFSRLDGYSGAPRRLVLPARFLPGEARA